MSQQEEPTPDQLAEQRLREDEDRDPEEAGAEAQDSE